jgi:protein-S-isoprenylcysteine O-methyltransferase Ste14
MLDNTFEILYLTFFIVGSIVRTIYIAKGKRWWRRKSEVVENRGTGAEKLLLFIAFLGMQVIPFIYIFSSWLNFADYDLPAKPSWILGGIGCVVFAVAIWALWRSHADLGRNFSPELKLREEHKLVTDGVFRNIRHPMYAAHWLWALAQAMLLQNWIAGWSMLVAHWLLYSSRITQEEYMMCDRFGDEYRDYMGRTGRIFPRLKK